MKKKEKSVICSSTDHDRSLASGTYLLRTVNRRFLKLIDVIESSSRRTDYLDKRGNRLIAPQDLEMFPQFRGAI